MAGEPTPPAHPDQPPARAFPWSRLLRAVAEAVDPKRLVLAALGLILVQLGWAGLDRLFPRAAASGAFPMVVAPQDIAGAALPAADLVTEAVIGAELRAAPWAMTEPVRVVVGPFLEVFSARVGGLAFLHALAGALWGVVVWAMLGGAIARVAVMRATRGERVGLPQAVRFAVNKTVALVSAPTSPLIGVAFFAALLALFGLVYRIPTIGPGVGGALAFLPLLAGLTMALILFGLAAGWPLMPAAVAAESLDGFDALSRAYSYVHQRPALYAASLALAWGLGSAGLVVVDLFARGVVALAAWGLSFSAPGESLSALFAMTPQSGPASTAARLHGFWLSVVGLLAHAWIYSYFWTAAATIYLALRREVDGTPWHVVALADRAAPRGVGSPGEAMAGSAPPAKQHVS